MPSNSLSLGVIIGASLGASFGNTMRTAEQRAGRLGKTLRTTNKKLFAANDLVAAKAKLNSLWKLQKQSGVASDELAQKIAKAERAYKKAAIGANKYGIEIGSAVHMQKRFSREVRETERNLARLGKRRRNKAIRGELRGQGLGMLGAAYALGAPLAASLNREQAGVRLKTVLNTKDTGKSLQLAREHATNFARKNLTNDVEMLNIQYALNSAGLEASAARVGSEVVAKVATVTKGAPEQVGEVVATVFNNLGDSLEGNVEERLTRIGELLTKTQFKFQIRDFGQLGESMKYAAPVISQYNMDLAQAATIIGQLNSSGLQGTLAGTAFSATMRNMSKAAQELGFEMVRNEKGQMDFIATMEQLSGAIGGFDNMDQDTIDQLQKVFGEEGVRGVTLLGKQLGKLRQAQDDVANSSKGIVDESYDEFLKSTGGQVKVFWHNISLLGEVFAGSFLPVLGQVLPPLISFVGQIGQALQDNPVLAQTIMGVAMGLVGLKAVTMGARFGMTLLSDGGLILGGVFKGLKTAFGLATTAFNIFKWVIVGNPVGAIITGLAIAAVLIYKNWDKVKGFLMSIWEPIKPYWEGFINWIGNVWDGVVDNIMAPFKAVGWVWEKVSGWLNSDTQGGSTTKAKQAAAGVAMTAAVAGMPAGATPATAPQPQSITAQTTINVQAAPGMNERELAELIERQQADAVRKAMQEGEMVND